MAASEHKSSSLQLLDDLLRGSSTTRFDDAQLKDVQATFESLLSQAAEIAKVDRDAVEQGLSSVQFRQGRSVTRLGTGGGFGHGPLDPIIPHDCHITIVLCNPLPFGPQVCVEIELPWPCGPV